MNYNSKHIFVQHLILTNYIFFISIVFMKKKTFFEQYKDLPQYHLNSHLIISCANGQLEHVMYLLSSKELLENADIHCDNDGAFISVCMYGYIEHYHHILIKQLQQNELYFDPNYDGLLQYFIFDKNLEKTESIIKFLDNIRDRHKDFVNNLEKMFSLRDFKNKLERELPVNTENSQEIRKQ